LRQLLARVCWGLTILYWLTLFAGTHVPGPKLPVIRNDKTIHFVGYALLAGAIMVSLRASGRIRAGSGIRVLAVVLAYGAVDEWTQALPFVHRSCEMADWHADAAGAATAVILCAFVLRPRDIRGSKMEDGG
jgi:VanZ family protein